MSNLRFFILVIGSVLIFTSCKKAKLNRQTTTSKDNSTAESIFADIKRVIEEASDENSNQKTSGYSFGACATVTVTPSLNDTVWPKNMVIDFGSSNCTGNYGITRRGKILVKLSGKYRDAGSVLTVTLDDYFVNNHRVLGKKTITNNGRNSSGNLSYTVKVTNGKVIYPDGGFFTWKSTRTNEWIEGESTTLLNGWSGICDDTYLITGSASGINKDGRGYTVNITAPLRKELCCRWIVSGKLEIKPDNLKTREVDFGSGACDGKATVKIGRRTYNISY